MCQLLVISILLLLGVNLTIFDVEARDPMAVMSELADGYRGLCKRMKVAGIEVDENLVSKPLNDKFIDILISITVSGMGNSQIEFWKETHRSLRSRDTPSGKESFTGMLDEIYNRGCETFMNTVDNYKLENLPEGKPGSRIKDSYNLCKATRKYIQKDDMIKKTYSAFRKRYSKLNNLLDRD